MTQNFRKTLMATTMLAGLAIFAIDTAQAGPNGGPSLGSISGFSSMRMDFNRIGGPGRALSRDDMRVVPLEVKKTIPSGIMPLPGKKDDKKKNIAKKDKGTNVARVSNSKSSVGGKGKQDVGNGPNLHINPAIVEAYAVTGGNLGDLSRFDEFAERLGIGPLVVNVPWGPSNGSFNPPVDKPGTEPDRFDPNSLLNFYPSAPGGPDTSRTGQAAVGKWRRDGEQLVGRYPDRQTWIREYNKERNQYRMTLADSNNRTVRTDYYPPGHRPEFPIDGERDYDSDHALLDQSEHTSEYKAGAGGSEDPKKEAAEKAEKEKAEKDSQPVEEGYGRPTNGGGWCSPTGGCYRPARNAGPRIIPTETQGNGTITARRQSPTWATDPSEEGYTGGGSNGGYSGHRPTDEQGGGIGGPGNPALDGLIAAI